jgi:microcystin-dependent protein
MAIEIPITSATVPSPLDCVVSNSNWQSLVSLLTATFPEDASIFNTGNSEPSPSRRAYPWFRFNSDGSPDRWYRYSMGAWLSLHPVAPGIVVMYEGTEASITTFDGGEAGVVTAISGPMWEKVTSINGRFPVGPGTLPSTAIIGIGDTGGEEQHTLVESEIPKHSHLLASEGVTDSTVLSSPNQILDRTVDDNSFNSYQLYGKAGEEATVGKTGDFGGDGPHTNMPPYLGIWFIRKTARLYYRI